MADPRQQIDISLSLIGAQSADAVNQLIQKMGDLDNKLQSIKIGGAVGGDAREAAMAYKQISDRSRNVIPTGSTTLADPMQARYVPSSYNIESARSVSPPGINEESAKRRLAEVVSKGHKQRENVPLATDFIGGETAPEWLNKREKQRTLPGLDKALEMPRYGEYTIQDKLELAANVASQRALDQYKNKENAARTQAQEAHKATIMASKGPDYKLSLDDQATIAEKGQEAVNAVTSSAGTDRLGRLGSKLSGTASRVAQASIALPFAAAALAHIGGSGGLKDVSAYDPRLLSPFHDIFHMASAGKGIEALGQQAGYQAGNADLKIGSGGWTFRNVNDPRFWKNPAGLEGADILAQAHILPHQFPRVTHENVAQYQADYVNAGYHGAQRQALTQAGAQITQNTSLDPTIVAPMLSDAVRYGNSSLKDMVNILNNVPAAAQRAGMSVNAYAEALHQFATDAQQTRGASIAGASAQGMALSTGFGMTLPDVQNLAGNSGVQTFTMANTGTIPGMQGNLPGSAIAQSAQEYVHMLDRASGAFTRGGKSPKTSLGAYGSVTQSATDARYAAISAESGGKITPAQVKAILDPKAVQRTQAETAISTMLNPSTGTLAPGTTERTIQQTALQQGLLGKGKTADFNEKWLNKIKNPNERLRQLQGAIGGTTPDNSGSGLPSAEVKISMTDDLKKWLNIQVNGGKKSKATKWDVPSTAARAGSTPTAGLGISPQVSAETSPFLNRPLYSPGG